MAKPREVLAFALGLILALYLGSASAADPVESKARSWGPEKKVEVEEAVSDPQKSASYDTGGTEEEVQHRTGDKLGLTGQGKVEQGKISGDNVRQKSSGTTLRNVERADFPDTQSATADKVGRFEQPASPTSKPTTLIEAVNVRKRGKIIEADAAERVEYENIVASDVSGLRVQPDGTITLAGATRIEIPDGILTQVRNFVGSEIKFSIGEARDVLIGCIALRQVRNADFTIDGNAIEIETGKGVAFDIADCGFGQSRFEASSEESKIVISQAKRASYEIDKGTLECSSLNSRERVEANSSATIQYGSSCFSCVQLHPASTYWYNSPTLTQDLGIHIPAQGLDFRLCLKKQPLDYFVQFDGILDFVNNEIALTKVVQLLKYPFHDHQPASLLMEPLVTDLDNYRVQMQLDGNFTFVQQQLISSNVRNESPGLKTTTSPDNFLELREQTVGNGTHRLARIDYQLESGALEQERILKYATSYFSAALEMADNKAVQRMRPYEISILPPGHEDIAELVG